MRTEVEIAEELRALAAEERAILAEAGAEARKLATAHPNAEQRERLAAICARVAELHREAR